MKKKYNAPITIKEECFLLVNVMVSASITEIAGGSGLELGDINGSNKGQASDYADARAWDIWGNYEDDEE